MRILVMGAGAIGGYLGCRLQQAGEDVIFCARGETCAFFKSTDSLSKARGETLLSRCVRLPTHASTHLTTS